MEQLPELWAHQKLAIEKARHLDSLALLCDPGVGKTRATIEILRGKYNASKRVMRTLIVNPLITCEQWKREFLKYSAMPAERIAVLTGPGPRRIKLFQTMVNRFGGNFIAVMNYEGLLVKGLYAELIKWRPEIVVLDEMHRVKDHKTSRVKLLLPLCDGAKYKYGLTGTPVLNSALDLFSQFRLLDGGTTFGRNFFAFRGTYFYDKNAGMPKQKYFPNWVFRKETTEHFQKKLQYLSVQARKEDCLDLPELVEVTYPVELGEEQARAYEEMKKQFVTFVQDKAVTAQMVLTQTIRMRQMIAGFAIPEHIPGNPVPEPVYFKENPRLDALCDLVENLVDQQQKVIIWSDFVATYQMIAKALGKTKIVFITGQESATQKERSVQDFCFGDAQVCIANPAAAGLGVNLTQSSASIYYTRDYSLEKLLQSQARNYRGGSEMHEKVTHYHLLAEKTIDEVIWNALKNKGNIAESLLAWANQGL